VTFAQLAPWIMWFESGFRNIPNEAGKSTATGYFQIVIGTWQEFGAKVPGALDYARAMDAPYAVQYAVAEQVYLGQGIKAWATWPKIIEAAGAAA
jgi:hypothetical protein